MAGTALCAFDTAASAAMTTRITSNVSDIISTNGQQIVVFLQ
jgi:hypothetical protein